MEYPFEAIFRIMIGSQHPLVGGNLILDNLKRSIAKGLDCDFKVAIFDSGLLPCNFGKAVCSL